MRSSACWRPCGRPGGPPGSTSSGRHHDRVARPRGRRGSVRLDRPCPATVAAARQIRGAEASEVGQVDLGQRADLEVAEQPAGTVATLGTTTVTHPAATAEVAPVSESSSATQSDGATPMSSAARR